MKFPVKKQRKRKFKKKKIINTNLVGQQQFHQRLKSFACFPKQNMRCGLYPSNNRTAESSRMVLFGFPLYGKIKGSERKHLQCSTGIIFLFFYFFVTRFNRYTDQKQRLKTDVDILKVIGTSWEIITRMKNSERKKQVTRPILQRICATVTCQQHMVVISFLSQLVIGLVVVSIHILCDVKSARDEHLETGASNFYQLLYLFLY